MPLGELLFGKEGELKRTPRYNQPQQEIFSQLGQMGMAGLQQTPLDFAPIEKRELSRFNQQTIPGIMERFYSRPGNLGSSALQGSLSQGAGDLGERLAALRSNYNLQARNQLMQMLGMSLAPQEETYYQPGDAGLVGALASGAGQGLGLLGSSYLGGGLGIGQTQNAPQNVDGLLQLLQYLKPQQAMETPNKGITYTMNNLA